MIDKLPLWAMRAYDRVWSDEYYRYIQTYNTVYVLDILTIKGNYWERRLKSLDMILPHKLYPLKKRFEYIDQVVSHTSREFIDEEGNLLIYKPTRFVDLKTDRIIAKWEARTGETMFRVHNCPRTFRVRYEPDEEYLTYVKDGNKFYMYELSHEKKAPRRKKI